MYRVTLAGMYNYDASLFDNLVLPDGINKTTFINTLLLSYGDCEPIYPIFDFFKTTAIPAWADTWEESIKRVAAALKTGYSPIENYDRNEEWTDSPDLTHEMQSGGVDGTVLTAGRTSTTTNSGADSTENLVSAFDSDSYQPSDKTVTNYGSSTELKTGGQDTTTVNYGRSEKTKESGKTTHSGRIHGNIGVTTNQQMITAELELRKTSLYGYIAGLFAQDLLILVY